MTHKVVQGILGETFPEFLTTDNGQRTTDAPPPTSNTPPPTANPIAPKSEAPSPTSASPYPTVTPSPTSNTPSSTEAPPPTSASPYLTASPPTQTPDSCPVSNNYSSYHNSSSRDQAYAYSISTSKLYTSQHKASLSPTWIRPCAAQGLAGIKACHITTRGSWSWTRDQDSQDKSGHSVFY
jgi:hypothetical protein